MKKYVLYFTFAIIFSTSLFSQNSFEKKRINDDLEYIKVSGNSFVIISYAEIGKYGRVASNHFIFINGDKALLINTPVNEALTKSLVTWIQDSLKVSITGFIAHHWHDDCIGGLDYIHKLGIKSYSSELTREITKSKNLPVPQTGFPKNMEVKIGDKKAVCTFFGAAHSTDNIVIWIPSEKILYAGCLAKETNSKSLGNLSDADLKEWPKTMKKILKKYSDAKIVIPGHGEIGDTGILRHTLNMLENSKDK